MQAERFSSSFLWRLQDAAYTQFGISAWSQQGVPFYLTSNPHTARQYAQVVLGYLRDLVSPDSPTPIDTSEPVYLFDLGAGTGRFGYLFLSKLLEILPYTAAKNIQICYVLTDISEENINFWREHPKLQPYFQSGVLDCAYFRHNQKEPIHLLVHQRLLDPESVKNPLILLANYFFDTIPQDFFRASETGLEEGRIALATKNEQGELHTPQDESPAQINQLTFDYSFAPIADLHHYYSNPLWNRVLEESFESYKGLSFLLPTGAFEVIDYFRKLSKGRLLVVAGDQGVTTHLQMKNMPLPRISLHGSFSVVVNYHALAIYLRLLGGEGLLTKLSDPLFVVTAGVLGASVDHFPETALAFRELIDRFEPKDYWFLASDLQVQRELTFDAMIRILKLGDWDPINFYNLFEALFPKLSQVTESQKNEISFAINQLERNFYPISKEDGAFYINLGVMAFTLKDFSKAIELFEKALKQQGESEAIYGNLSACYQAMGDSGKARDYFLKAQRARIK